MNNINCTEVCELSSNPNDIKILLMQIKKDMKELMENTEAKLLLHDRKNSRIM